MDVEYAHCSARKNHLNADEDSCSSKLAKSPVEPIVPGSSSNMILNSDSEDDLPAYGFNWTPNNKEVQKVKLDMEETSAGRKKYKQFVARLDKLDDLIKGKIEPNMCAKLQTEDVKTGNEITKFLSEKVKEMEIEEFTVKNVSKYEIIKLEQSLKIFDHKSLVVESFLKECSMVRKLQLLSPGFDNMDCSAFNFPLRCEEDQEGICSFLFFIMSVHPNFDNVNFCYHTLIREGHFCPCFSDFINVFLNWGCDLHDLYESVPDIYTGLLSSFGNKSPDMNMKVKEHNMTFVFLYLTYIVRRQPPDTFCYLIEPLLRLFFDVKIYSNTLQHGIIDIIILLIGLNYSSSKELIPRRVSVKEVHIRNMSLIRQTEICTKIFYHTCFGFPLGFAILQQFLGCSMIKYCQEVNLQAVYTLLTEKNDVIAKATYLEIFCYLEIVTMFLFRYELVAGKVQTQKTSYDDWYDLLHDWSLYISHNDEGTYPLLLKDKISKLQYQIYMKQAFQIRKNREISYIK